VQPRQPRREKYPNSMLVPLVFLILPVTVAFAIFPGILVLQLRS
jgi:pilus assembly protein TadC